MTAVIANADSDCANLVTERKSREQKHTSGKHCNIARLPFLSRRHRIKSSVAGNVARPPRRQQAAYQDSGLSAEKHC